MLMLIVSWLGWWYSRGWSDLAHGTKRRLGWLYLDFSVPLLLQTLLSPWRRIVTGKQGALSQRLRAMLDNTVSRAVGLAVRLLALAAAGVSMLLVGLGGLIAIIVWPLIPPAAVILIVVGIIK